MALSLPGGSGAFTLAAWNIHCGRNAGLTSAAKGLVQMGVGLAVLTKTKLTDDRHTRLASGYKVLASKAASHNQGGIALLWKENHTGYEVESVCIVTPNHLTFQLATGSKQFYCMGIYIPPPTRWGWTTSGPLGMPVSRLHPRCPGRPEYQLQGPLEREGRAHCGSPQQYQSC